jgi:hypothetical protein
MDAKASPENQHLNGKDKIVPLTHPFDSSYNRPMRKTPIINIMPIQTNKPLLVGRQNVSRHHRLFSPSHFDH